MLTTEVFLAHMDAVKEHYLSGAETAYPMPIQLLVPPMTLATTEPNASLQAIMDDAKNGSLSVISQAKTDGEAGINGLKSAKTSGVPVATAQLTFKQQMESKKNAAIASSKKTISDAYNKLIKQGTEHPEQQSQILSLGDALGKVFKDIGDKIAAFFVDIGAKIVEWFNDVVDWFKKAGEAIGNWFKGAAHSIGHFFSNLF